MRISVISNELLKVENLELVDQNLQMAACFAKINCDAQVVIPAFNIFSLCYICAVNNKWEGAEQRA